MYDEHDIISPSKRSTADPPAIEIVAVPNPIFETLQEEKQKELTTFYITSLTFLLLLLKQRITIIL